jgi:cytochrome c-type biogenesis protein CcmH
MKRQVVVGWLIIAVVGLSAFVYGSIDEGTPQTDADRAYRLAQDFACPRCDGQSVAESDVLVATTIRRQIRIWVDEGRSDDFIRSELVKTYGEDIDYTPSSSGVTALVWVIPVVGAVAAGAGLVLVFRRWSTEAALEASDDDEALVAAIQRDRDGERP